MVVLIENVLLAIEGLRANKMRALLTMLGIIIGIGSVIGIVTVGDSMSQSVSSEMSGFGATNVMVAIAERGQNGESGSIMNNITRTVEDSDRITDEMIEKFREVHADEVEGIGLSTWSGQGRAEDGRLYANVLELGASPDVRFVDNIELIGGRFIRDADVVSKRMVAVVSDKFVNNMFPGVADPLGRQIKVTIYGDVRTYTVVGIYKYEEQGMMVSFTPTADRDIRTDVFVPISTAQMLSNEPPGYYDFTVKPAAGVDPMSFAVTIAEFFNKYYYAKNQFFEVATMPMDTLMSMVTSMLGTISIAIAVIAGISLLVGGIGVMNIMLVSVTERTKEIGTRKALGARNSAIRVQFIVEAVIICSIGGLLGIGLGAGIGAIGSSLIGFATTPSLSIVIIAVLFSMLIGVFFGYYPANKAAKLDPIEALRYE